MKYDKIEQKLTCQIRRKQTNRRKKAQEKAQELDSLSSAHSGVP